MNKKVKNLASCILIITFMMASTAQAEEQQTGFTGKLSQGMANMLFGFIEIPKNVINITNQHNIFVGMTWGVIRGTMHGVSRTVVGSAEFLTSPIPTSDFTSPAYVWDRFSEDSRYFNAHYPGYWTVYGPVDDGE